MDAGLRKALTRDGATFGEGARSPAHFGDPVAELGHALGSCAVADRSDTARIVATGPDLLDLLQRLSTGDVASLRENGGCPTVLTTAKGRIVQRLFVQHLGPDGVLLLGGPGSTATVRAHLERFVFSEQLDLTDVDEAWSFLAVVGPRAKDAVRDAGLAVPDEYGTLRGELDGVGVFVLGHDGLSKSGVSIVVPGSGADRVWRRLREHIAAAGDVAMEARRVLRGLPENGSELNEGHNPLEAGLWDAVSFDKGCYVGQEVVARLRTYDKVSSDLRGFLFPTGAPVPVRGTALRAGSRSVGGITSALVPPGRDSPVALGYVKREHSAPGTELTAGELRATVVELPFEGPE